MPLSPSVIKSLKYIVGPDNCLDSKEDMACYAYDTTPDFKLPDAVVFPKTAQEVSAILDLANQKRFFVTPRGAGTGMTGGSVPARGGVVLAMTRFDRILEIDIDNMVAIVQPGVITGRFQKAVEEKGLFYPPDPSSAAVSTLGGNAAECAGGPRAVKYGVTRDYVLGLEVVLPTGEIVKTGVKTAKGVAGLDLTRLIIGSEGILGVITQLTLRLLPQPEAVGTLTAVFDTIGGAACAVCSIMRSGIIPRTLEYMDQAAVLCVENHLHAGLPVDAGAVLLIEVDGSTAEVSGVSARLASLLAAENAREVRTAGQGIEADLLWKARKTISPALFTYAPDKLNEDIVVPKSRIPDMVLRVAELSRKTGLTMVSFGHAGDGNIHVNIMYDRADADQREAAQKAVDAVFDYTLALGGTITGEHGVGTTKAAYLKHEISPPALALMKRIKTAFDPKGILNPGKIFDG
ncbi:MAG: FAD-binding protein [Deltaproteobacteria bacterium]|nr:FAD-binding protein [Deltaproteobacteria bacterium]